VGGAGQTYLWPNIQQQIVRPAVAVNEMSFAVLLFDTAGKRCVYATCGAPKMAKMVQSVL